MVPICRSAPFLLVTDVVKALPSRQPETKAAQNATAMMGHPTRQIQQGPIGCPTCGHAHRTGTVCSAMKSVEGTFLDDLFGKGVMTISGQKRGNPYRDEGTGRFAASPQGGAGAAGGAGGGEPTQENTVMGTRPAAPAQSENIGTANTMEAPAPSGGTVPGIGGSPTPPAQDAGGAAGGNSTTPGKQGPQNMPGITPSMIARHEQQQADDQGFLDKLLAKPQPATPSGPKNVFSHEGAQQAYQAEKDRAMSAGSSPDEAHAAGMKAGGQAYSDSIRDPNAPPSARGPQQSPPTRSAPNVMPGPRATSMPTTPGGPATAPGGSASTSAGTIPNMPAATPPGGGGASPAAPGPSAAPVAPGSGGGSPSTGAPKTPKTGGGKQQGFLEGLVKPWEHAAHGMGAGLATPGGTIGATNSAVTGAAHGLLHHQNEQKPASQQHQQKVQSAQKQPGAMANQQTSHLNSMRQFAGQTGSGGSGMPGGTP